MFKGPVLNELPANNIPSKKEVLQYFYSLKNSGMDYKQCSINVAVDLIRVYQLQNRETRAKYHVSEAITKLNKRYLSLKKGRRNTDAFARDLQCFRTEIAVQFDISKQITNRRIENQEQEPLLMEPLMQEPLRQEPLLQEPQRQANQLPGSSGANVPLLIENVANYSLRQPGRHLTQFNEIEDNDQQDNDPEYNSEPAPPVPPAPPAPRRVARPFRIGADLAEAYDRVNLSNRGCHFVFLKTIENLGLDKSETVCSISTARRVRIKAREDAAKSIKRQFNPDCPVSIHWDGKIFKGNQKDDKRLAVVASFQGQSKLLETAPVRNGYATTYTEKISGIIYQWGLEDRVNSICFDTEPTNAGGQGGVAFLLQVELEKELLLFACRHHIMELMLKEAFTFTIEKGILSKSPYVQIFRDFRQTWLDGEIDINNFHSCMRDRFFIKMLGAQTISDIKQFCTIQLRSNQNRDDYKELLLLTKALLSTNEENVNFNIQTPGACSRARFMAKVIYSIKLYMFRKQILLSRDELIAL